METLPEPIERKNQRDIIVDVLNGASFTARDREVIHKRYFGGCTHREIAESWGVCIEYARQIELKLLRRLRHPAYKGLFAELR